MKMTFALLIVSIIGINQTAQASEVESFLSARTSQTLSTFDKEESASRFVAAADALGMHPANASECKASFVGFASLSLSDPCTLVSNARTYAFSARSGGTSGGTGSN